MTHFEPMGGPFFKIPADSNLRWMVMFYALPREFVEKQPVLLNMPRKIRDVIKSDEWMELVNSDVFLELIWDSYAWIAWQFFEVPHARGGRMPVPGSVNQYSGNFPLWRYAYMVPSLILKRFEVMPQFSLQTLFLMGKDYEAPWSIYETFYGFIGQMTLEIIGEQNWQPEFDVVWDTRAHEDYNGTSVKQQDFERAWNHSRTPKENVSIEDIKNDPTGTAEMVMKHAEKHHQSFEDCIAEDDMVKRFVESLPEIDQKILALRDEDKTLAEIAQAVGFASAGTVSKHLCKIGTQLKAYRSM